MKSCFKADKVILKNGGIEDIIKWRSKSDILAYLRPLKRNDDKKLPSKRNEIEALCILWKNRDRKNLSNDDHVLK